MTEPGKTINNQQIKELIKQNICVKISMSMMMRGKYNMKSKTVLYIIGIIAY